MKAFFYYAAHTLINQIRKLMKTYVIILLVCVLFGGVIGGLAGMFTEDSEPEDVVQAEETISDDAGDPELMASFVSLISGGVILAALLWNVVTAEKSGSGIFHMADVNLLFQAPMKPQSVLLFRLIFKMGGLIAAGLYLIFQIPNLHMNMGVPLGACIAMLAVWGLTLVTGQLLSVLVYTVTATHVRLRKYIVPVAVGICGIAALTFAAYWQSSGGDLLSSAFAFWCSKGALLVPIWGWIKAVLDFSLIGNYLAAAGMGVLCLAVIGVLIAVIWRIRADFYEDAMAKSEETAAVLAQTKEKGRVVTRKKERSERLRRNGKIGGSGASALFYKNMYNRRRFAKFGVFTSTMVTYLLAAVFVVWIVQKTDAAGGMYWVVAVLGVLAYFRSLGNPLEAELKTSFFVTLPAGAYQKFGWTILSGSVSCLLDLLPAVLVSVILLGESALIPAVSGVLFILSLDFFSANAGALADLSLPTSISQGVKVIIQVCLVYLGLVPAAAVIIMGLMFHAIPAAIVGVALVDTALGLIAFAIAPQLIKNGRR